MTGQELDQLVAAIGDALLARMGTARPARGEGLEIGAAVCPGCTQRCVETCLGKSRAIVAAGADRMSASERVTGVDPALAAMIDHTLLRADATQGEIDTLCAEAARFRFASVCVNGYWVPRASAALRGTGVKVCTVIGFPLGATTTEAKAAETESAIRAGAEEVDMVINVGALKSGDVEGVRQDIAAVVRAAHGAGVMVKVILETALLEDGEKRAACGAAKAAGADFVKTSTGFSKHGATVHDVALMREAVGPAMGVKASGGIRTREDAVAMAAAGATRIGASASVKIVGGGDAGAQSY
ncbi:MAG: deoxyribose-phosphate aldolase [Bryobacteraceae bacterium]